MSKIIRAVTVPQSIGFFREVMVKMRGMGNEMIALSSPGPQLEELKDQDGFKTFEVAMERRMSPFKDIRSLFKLIKVFRKEKPDVVHSMTPKAGLLCMLASWFARVPVRIHTFTGLVWPTSKGLSRMILKTTDRITCACATHVIPEGQGVLNDLKSGKITRKPMKVLGYGNVMGIDLERFNPGRFVRKANDGTMTFLFVGRIVGDKGINELVEAFVALNKEYPNTRLKLVGRYEENLDPIKPETKQIIDEHEAIELAGARYGDDLLQEYMDADIFVMPSYREGFPNTVIEAGAMNLPSVVTDINGSREIITDGENGLIVPPQTTEPLYVAMKRLIEDEALRNSIIQNARPMIASRFEKSFVHQCLIDFYNEIIKK